MIPLNAHRINKEYKECYADVYITYIEQRSTKYKLSDLNYCVNEYFQKYGVTTFKTLLLVEPKKMMEIVEVYNNSISDKQKIEFDKIMDFRILYDYFSNDKFKNEAVINNLTSKSHFEKIDIENCPYCNENKTTHFDVKNNNDKVKLKRIYDWDHFYPKDKYPFLAISLYNLIPSCKVCNFLKLTSDKDFMNPYEDYSIDDYLTFYLELDDIDYLITSENFDISKNTKGDRQKQLDNILDTIHLLDRYKANKEMLKFNLIKYKEFNTNKKKIKEFGIIDQTENLLGQYFGVYTSPENYSKMPYSKLLSDIFIRKS